ncbi:MAG: hypothetical protein AB7R90_19525 [Reyranellaceae bacterium]
MSDPTQQGHVGQGRGAKVHFDRTISLGHILQVVVIVIPIATWGIRVETRQAEVDVRLVSMQREMDRNDLVLNDKLRGLQNTLDRIELKLDQKADKPVAPYRP